MSTRPETLAPAPARRAPRQATTSAHATGSGLTKKWHGIPIWVWAVGGGVAGWYLWTHVLHKSSTSTTTTAATTTTPATTSTTSGTTGATSTGGGGGGLTTAVRTSGGGSIGTTPAAPSTIGTTPATPKTTSTGGGAKGMYYTTHGHLIPVPPGVNPFEFTPHAPTTTALKRTSTGLTHVTLPPSPKTVTPHWRTRLLQRVPPIRHVATTLASTVANAQHNAELARRQTTPAPVRHTTTKKAPAKRLAATVANAEHQAMLARRQGSR